MTPVGVSGGDPFIFHDPEGLLAEPGSENARRRTRFKKSRKKRLTRH